MAKEVSGHIGNAFERLKKRYDSAGTPYEIATRPYYCAFAVLFNVVDVFVDGGVPRAFAVATASSFNQFDLFGYKKGDDLTKGYNIPRAALDEDCNQATAYRTNGEDFAVEGISSTSRGVRPAYPAARIAAIAAAGEITNPFVTVGLTGVSLTGASGTTFDDPGAVVVPPEFISPVVLEDLGWRAISPKMTLQTSWNRKAVDLIGTMDEFPEGGAKSYLRANGEPSHHNYVRIPEGWIWERDGAAEDTIFAIHCNLNDQVIVPITQGQGYQSELTPLGFPDFIFLEGKIRAHGRALFTQSKNV